VNKAGEVRVSGSRGTFGLSRDGGKSWRLINVPGGDDFDYRGIAVPAPDQVFLMSTGPAEGGKARILASRDGGMTWSVAFETHDAGVFFDAMIFRNAQTGFVLGDPVNGGFYLLVTRDSGRTWTRVNAHFPALEAKEAAFAASNSSLAIGSRHEAWIVSGVAEKARVFASADDGLNWSAATAPLAGGATAGLFGVWFADSRHGVAVGGDHRDESATPNIIFTNNGGRSWALASHHGPGGLKEAVGRLRARSLLAVGPRGTSLSLDGGRSWRSVDTVPHHAISCTNGTCYAVGPQGRVSVWR
jgi:photosystem II stability/assembly factor-like uncharacterized protein